MNKRTIELEKLPTRKLGSRDVIDWKNIKNKEIGFQYGSIIGKITINYTHTEKGSSGNNVHYCDATYNGKTISIADSNLRKVKIGALLGVLIEEIREQARVEMNESNNWVFSNKSSFKYKLGEKIKKGNTTFTVVRAFRNKRNKKAYKVRCSTCLQHIEREEYDIENSKNCAVCFNREIVKGFNDVATTHPWVLKNAVNKEVLYKNSFGSLEKVVIQCPTCYKAQNISIVDLTGRGFSCSCSTSSLGEQIFESCLRINEVSYEKEYYIKGSNRRYDFYLPEYNTIVEIHGSQHYRETKGWGTLSETQENDANKKKKALSLGYKFIELNWGSSNTQALLKEIKSKFVYMKDFNIYKELETLPELKRIVQLWEENPYNSRLIEKELKVGATTRKKLLRQAKGLGLIEYDSEFAQSKNKIKAVVCLNERRVYSSISEAGELFNIDKSSIGNNCRNNFGIETKSKSAGRHPITKEKLQWMFYDDYKERYGEKFLIFNTLEESDG